MLNQTSFRLTTTLLPTDMQAKTTRVINKVNANGEGYYPTFVNETVVLTNEDRTVMETARANCNNGILSFIKRGLSDDETEISIEKRKLTRNPGSLCFVTYGAGDAIDKDGDNVWTGKQTYTGEIVSTNKAIYKGKLITESGIEYPVFPTVDALNAYPKAFAGMFAVVESDGEVYKYNEKTKSRGVVTTAQPLNLPDASKTAKGVVRIATDEEFSAEKDIGEDGSLLVPTPKQVGGKLVKATVNTAGIVKIANDSEFRKGQSVSELDVPIAISPYHLMQIKTKVGIVEKDGRQIQLSLSRKGETINTSFIMPFDGFFVFRWNQQFITGLSINACSVLGAKRMSGSSFRRFSGDLVIEIHDLYYARKGETVSIEYLSTNGEYDRGAVHNNAKKALILTDGIYIGI